MQKLDQVSEKIENVITEELMSSDDNRKITNDKLKEIIKEKILKNGYLEEDWQMQYVVERIFNNVRKEGFKKGLATASLVFSLIGGYISTMSVVAVVCGHLALNKIKKDSNIYGGKKLAIAGLVLGYSGLIIGLVLGILRGTIKNKLGY